MMLESLLWNEPNVSSDDKAFITLLMQTSKFKETLSVKCKTVDMSYLLIEVYLQLSLKHFSTRLCSGFQHMI